MPREQRPVRLAMRLSEVEGEVVAAVCEETGLSISDVIRQALRIAYADRFKKPKPKK